MAALKKFWVENSLSIVMFGLFLLFLVGLSIAGLLHENEELAQHGKAAISYWEYVASGNFVEAVFENWESEFLQMWALVILTVMLRQKGAVDSKKIEGTEPVDEVPSRKDLLGRLYSRSLGVALLALFLASFALHALGGVSAYNDEASQHGEELISVWQYITSSQFWFESFQNWQSEFFAVGSLLLLSIFLREHGSPESKPVDAPNEETGSS
jgi:hypothetical protein